MLVFDLELAPIGAHVWGLYDQTVGVNQIEHDWSILAFAAKWLGEKKIFYFDQRKAKNVRDDKALCKRLWDLLNEADCVITQNGKAFDAKKANARFIFHGLPPPKPYRHIDTKVLAKKQFLFSSNSLEFLAQKLTKEKKSPHQKFPGFSLWSECLKGNQAAWREMERYNKQDVIATEAVYKALQPWGIGIDFKSAQETFICPCGSVDFIKKGFNYTKSGKFQQYQCKACGSWHSDSGDKNNLLSKEVRDNMRKPKKQGQK